MGTEDELVGRDLSVIFGDKSNIRKVLLIKAMLQPIYNIILKITPCDYNIIRIYHC